MAGPPSPPPPPPPGEDADDPVVDLVLPVYNEGPNIARALAEIDRKVPIAKRALIVYDFDEDDTVPAVRAVAELYPWAVLVRNDGGRGVVHAVRAGIAAARAEAVVITMADLSDDVAIVPRMVALIRDEGYDIVCASRYMPGGRQEGGPLLKRTLSRGAGLALRLLARWPTHDATNAFRAYRRTLLQATPIEGRGGFAFALEVTARAIAAGARVAEVPTTWRDRSAGVSRFRLRAWLPEYLRWFRFALTHRAPRR